MIRQFLHTRDRKLLRVTINHLMRVKTIISKYCRNYTVKKNLNIQIEIINSVVHRITFNF